MNKINIHFFHGWAFDGSFWTPLKKELNKYFSCKFYVYNQGFFGAEYLPKSLDTKNLNIIIVHSYGFNWVVKNMLYSDLLINFFGSPVFSDVNQKKVLQKTIDGLKKNSEKVLKQFYLSCGLDRECHNLKLLNKKKLLLCLNELMEDDLVSKTSKLKNKVFSFYSKSDNILRCRDFSQYFLNKNHRYIKYFNFHPHAFPFLQPIKCSNILKLIIENFLKKKSNE